MAIEPIGSRSVDRILVHTFQSNDDLGKRAADDLASLLEQIIHEQGSAAIVLATGNSQLAFMKSLRARTGMDWGKVLVFHMDEYLGMSSEHPASFARFIREKVTDLVHPKAFFPIRGDAPDVEAELKRYSDLLRRYPPDVCVLGIGENGHLAFNDPPADFETKDIMHIVNLDEKCRTQQVNEGHFTTLGQVPKQAFSMTVPALLAARHVLAVVPESRKAVAVKAALEGPLSPNCPASILRTQPRVTMYLDKESASLLS